jgi:DNA-binding response OmpR family regulator
MEFGDKFIHSGAKQMLGKMGHRITLATNGPEALEQWRQGDFDLILMDVQMPEMNGLAGHYTNPTGSGLGATYPLLS